MKISSCDWPFAASSPEDLLDSARKARLRSYAPYSFFKVGAAILTESGTVVPGCNVENSSYGLTLCAERVAIFSAIASNSGTPVAIAIAGESGVPCNPCGACLQVLAEFSNDILIVLESAEQGLLVYRLDEMLPLRFRLARGGA